MSIIEKLQSVVNQLDANNLHLLQEIYSDNVVFEGKNIIISVISKIVFEEKIVYHHDYFDLDKMLYEQLPYLGPIIKLIKKRLGQ